MQSLNFVLLLVAVGSATACKYFCRPPGTFEYECCDDGNPYFTGEISTADTKTSVTSDNQTESASTDVVNESTQAPSRCYYYCAYDGEVYCCGDDSRPIPENHDMHEGRCPEEDEQICKGTGVFLIPSKSQGKANGAIRLASGPGKEQPTCASDGYCSADEKCCPSKCARKHICLKSVDEQQ